MEKNSFTVLTCNIPSVIYRYLTHIAIVAKSTVNDNFFQGEGKCRKIDKSNFNNRITVIF